MGPISICTVLYGTGWFWHLWLVWHGTGYYQFKAFNWTDMTPELVQPAGLVLITFITNKQAKSHKNTTFSISLADLQGSRRDNLLMVPQFNDHTAQQATFLLLLLLFQSL